MADLAEVLIKEFSREGVEPDAAAVGAILSWCAIVGREPHQCFLSDFSVHQTNVAGRIWNRWERHFPELRNKVLMQMALTIAATKLSPAGTGQPAASETPEGTKTPSVPGA